MAEIPPHLLARSAARKAAAAGAPADAAAVPATVDAGAAPAPAKKAAAPAAAPPPPPVAAAPKPMADDLPPGRRRMPVWVMPVFAVLPLFAFFYAHGYQTPPVEAPSDPLVLGAELYRSQGCSGCHGAAGEGGVGPKLSGDDSELTFPEEADHAAWIRSGSAPFAGQFYGAEDRPGGQRKATGAMPGFPSLSDEEIDALVKYEREKL